MKEHKQMIEENRLGVLSAKAERDYHVYLAHHLEAMQTPSLSNLGTKIDHSLCPDLLRKYVCQLQFPRCHDDTTSTTFTRPIQLHVCYSLCHDVRDSCHLHHRIDCRHHHAELNPDYEPPTEHQLRFDPRYQVADPFVEFYRIDCIDSPPSGWKYIWHYIWYDGPMTVLLYTLSSIVVYIIISKLMGFNMSSPNRRRKVSETSSRSKTNGSGSTPTADVIRARRVEFDSKMNKYEKRYIKYQEIKTAMLQQQEEEMQQLEIKQQQQQQQQQQEAKEEEGSSTSSRSSHPNLLTLQSSISAREQKLVQLDELITSLEDVIQHTVSEMQSNLTNSMSEELHRDDEEDEDEEDDQLLNSTHASVSHHDADEYEEEYETDDSSVKLFGQRRRPVSAYDDRRMVNKGIYHAPVSDEEI